MRVAYTNFTGGEISHSLASRYDLGKFRTSCRHMENMLPNLHGPASKRPGTRFLEDLGGPAVLLPFQFSADPAQNYVLVFQEGKIRVAQSGGFVRYDEAAVAAREAEQGEVPLPQQVVGDPVTMDAPYLFDQLYDLSFAQSGDLV